MPKRLPKAVQARINRQVLQREKEAKRKHAQETPEQMLARLKEEQAVLARLIARQEKRTEEKKAVALEEYNYEREVEQYKQELHGLSKEEYELRESRNDAISDRDKKLREMDFQFGKEQKRPGKFPEGPPVVEKDTGTEIDISHYVHQSGGQVGKIDYRNMESEGALCDALTACMDTCDRKMTSHVFGLSQAQQFDGARA
jgi:hypothetical protein